MKLAHAVIAALALSSTAVLANDNSSKGTTSSNAAQSSASQPQSSQSAGSSDIRQAQQALKDKGLDVTVDGKMGPKTEAAIKQFQQENNLTASGQLDQKTLTALNGSASSSSSSDTSSMSSSPSSSSSSSTPSSSTSQTPASGSSGSTYK